MTRDFDYDPLNDILFKFIFGADERKQITIDFLNAVLGREGTNAIREIEFHNIELVPQRKEEKLSRIDIFALLDNKERVDIEVQCINYHNMEKRSLFYWAHMFLHSSSLHPAQDYRAINPAIAVNVLSFNFLPCENPHSMYSLYNAENMHRLTDAIELHFLEVPKFRRKPISEMSRVEKWLAFFSKKLSKVEKEGIAMSEPAIREAMTAADVFFMNDDAYREYVNRMGAILDYNSGINFARREGIEIGIEKGIEKGIESVAVNMIRDGESFEKIHKFTALPTKRIEELADSVL